MQQVCKMKKPLTYVLSLTSWKKYRPQWLMNQYGWHWFDSSLKVLDPKPKRFCKLYYRKAWSNFAQALCSNSVVSLDKYRDDNGIVAALAFPMKRRARSLDRSNKHGKHRPPRSRCPKNARWNSSAPDIRKSKSDAIAHVQMRGSPALQEPINTTHCDKLLRPFQALLEKLWIEHFIPPFFKRLSHAWIALLSGNIWVNVNLYSWLVMT